MSTFSPTINNDVHNQRKKFVMKHVMERYAHNTLRIVFATSTLYKLAQALGFLSEWEILDFGDKAGRTCSRAELFRPYTQF